MGDFRAQLRRWRNEEHRPLTGTLEARVHVLEERLRHTQEMVNRLVDILEHRFGEELDDDIHIGSRIA